jgi:hypothetical protein
MRCVSRPSGQRLDHVVEKEHRIARIQRRAQVPREQLPLVLLVRLESNLFPHEPRM